MKKEYLSEAFRQLELLNEEDFNLSTTADNSDLKDFLDNDDMSVMSLDVIDPEAETEEDLEDSYTGKVILDCCVCHSKLYKDKEEITVNEEEDLANVGEECPFCYSNDGFKIIGEVAPYGESEEEPDVKDEEHEDDVPEGLDESLKTRNRVNNLQEATSKAMQKLYDIQDNLDFVPGEVYTTVEDGYLTRNKLKFVEKFKDGNEDIYKFKPVSQAAIEIAKEEADDRGEEYDGFVYMNKNSVFYSFFDGLPYRPTKLPDDYVGWTEWDNFNTYYNTKYKNSPKGSSIYINYYSHEGFILYIYIKMGGSNKLVVYKIFDTVEEAKQYAENWIPQYADFINSNPPRRGVKFKIPSYLVDISDYDDDGLFDEIKNYVEFDESLKTRKNRKLKESLNIDDLINEFGYSTILDCLVSFMTSEEIDFVVSSIYEYMGDDYDENDVKSALNDFVMDYDNGDEIAVDEIIDSLTPERLNDFLKLYNHEGFDESLTTRRNKSVNESEEGKKLFTEYKILVDGRTYEISHTKQRADEIVPILKDMYPDSEIEAKPYKHYASGIERKRLEKQIADQLKEYGVNESVNESIQEIEIETDTDKIKIESEPKEESGEDVLAPVSPETEHQIENNSSDEIDVPIDEFDEDTFDELGESFLKNTYENVESYKTESIREQDGNKLVVEGLITFSSGKVKKTSFIFEAKDITKSGKVRFIGENCQLSRGKKSFTVAGKIQEGKFISESLNYNYRAKDAKSGKSTRMYGTVRTNK